MSSTATEPTAAELLAALKAATERIAALEQKSVALEGEVSRMRPFPDGEKPNVPRDETGTPLEGEYDETGIFRLAAEVVDAVDPGATPIVDDAETAVDDVEKDYAEFEAWRAARDAAKTAEPVATAHGWAPSAATATGPATS
jgi:hypothetical protein